MKLRLFFSMLLFSLLAFSGISQVTASVIPIVDDEPVAYADATFSQAAYVVVVKPSPVVKIDEEVPIYKTLELDMSPKAETVVKESEPPHRISYVMTTCPPSTVNDFFISSSDFIQSNNDEYQKINQLDIDHPDI